MEITKIGFLDFDKEKRSEIDKILKSIQSLGYVVWQEFNDRYVIYEENK